MLKSEVKNGYMLQFGYKLNISLSFFCDLAAIFILMSMYCIHISTTAKLTILYAKPRSHK